MVKPDKSDIKKLIARSIEAVEREIEMVQVRPSSDVLFNGEIQPKAAGIGKKTDYKFTTDQTSIQYAEAIKAKDGNKEWLVTPVSFNKTEVVLRFPENVGTEIRELQVEWENDYVLQCMKKELIKLKESSGKLSGRIEALFHPNAEEVAARVEISDDGTRNSAQRQAIEKSMNYRTVFIWGPPGTGKTSTLGYIIANYLKEGQRVLFVSNTNRAVDIGLLSALEAIRQTGMDIDPNRITRFGEPALDDETVLNVSFVVQNEKIRQEKRETANEWLSLLERDKKLRNDVKKNLEKGKKPSEKQMGELDLIDKKIRQEGDREIIEAKVEELLEIHEHSEFMNKSLVATTLATVCTSDFFGIEPFDAVVIDEASMANLPYMLVMAAKARWHLVVVGDPMQLPPIALTGDRQARELLESDIFTTVSGADTTENLFEWHDENPEFTCFFDTQYRLEPSLADLISTVFYEGRLKTNLLKNGQDTVNENRAYHLVDTSRYNPVLRKKNNDRGFHPVNEIHQELIEKLIRNMTKKGIRTEQIGVMVPFRAAVYDLRNRLYESSIKGIEVGTIHTFQGREKPYIIFDTVMSGELQRSRIRHYPVRLFDESRNGLSVPRLLNVAFSRSQKELIILADMRHIKKIYGSRFLGRLLEKMKR